MKYKLEAKAFPVLQPGQCHESSSRDSVGKRLGQEAAIDVAF